MLGRRQKTKYEIIQKEDDGSESDIDLPKKKLLTPACIWTCLSTAALISIYFAPSIGLTFYQRWLLQKFKFPLTTVLIHMSVKYMLAALVRCVTAFKYGKNRVNVGWKEYIISVGPTGFFSGIDIGFSQWGLGLITISLYTMTKSTTIIFILLFAILMKLEKKSWSLCTIVIMISTGLFLFTYKSTQFDVLGFVLILIASVSSGLRWTCVQLLLQKSKMGMRNPVDMVYHMQPFMFISILPFFIVIEGRNIVSYTSELSQNDTDELYRLILLVLIGAVIGFFMEIAEVLVVTYTSSLTLSIAGIFKELLILVLAVVWNGDQMSLVNVVGLLVCLGGIVSHVVNKIQTTQMQAARAPFDFDDHQNYDLGKSLMQDHQDVEQISVSSESDADDEVLFSILNRHDR